MEEKIKFIIKGLRYLELLIACLLFIAILISVVFIAIDTFKDFSNLSLTPFLETILSVVVGIEFAKMLILHTPQSVIEVLLYAVARQIIISHDNAMENLIGVLAIAIIFVISKFLFVNSFNKSEIGDQDER